MSTIYSDGNDPHNQEDMEKHDYDKEQDFLRNEENAVQEENEQAMLRNQLYDAIKETRRDPGLSIESIAHTLVTALSREEAQALRNELDNMVNA